MRHNFKKVHARFPVAPVALLFGAAACPLLEAWYDKMYPIGAVG